jgi:hypothetical protein
MVAKLFWLQWTLVTSLCFVLLWPMWNYVGIFSVIMYWFLLGFSQALLLRQKSPRLFTSWFLITGLIGVSLLGILALFAGFIYTIIRSIISIGFATLSWGMAGLPLHLSLFIFYLPLLTLIGGILISWVQGRVLQLNATAIRWWISASAISWMLGSGLLIYIFFLLGDRPSNRTFSQIGAHFSIMISLASVGAVGGAIRGGILTWLLLQSRK